LSGSCAFGTESIREVFDVRENNSAFCANMVPQKYVEKEEKLLILNFYREEKCLGALNPLNIKKNYSKFHVKA
jgi:hypothetical protein